MTVELPPLNTAITVDVTHYIFMHCTGHGADLVDDWYPQAEFLASLAHHPNIARFCGVCLEPPIRIVMQLYPR